MGTEPNHWHSRVLMLVKLYLATGFFLWQFGYYYIAGNDGLTYHFTVSGWGRAVEAGYLLALFWLVRHVTKKLKARQRDGVVGSFIFIIVGVVLLMTGAGIQIETVNIASRVLATGMGVAMAYISWRAWRQLDCRGFGYIFLAQALRLMLAAGWWIFLQPRRGASGSWGQRDGQWFWEYYWVGETVAGVLMAAGAIQIIRSLRTGSGNSVKPVSAGTMVLTFVFLLIGLQPATILLHSSGIITAFCVNIAVLAVALASPRHLKLPTIGCWSWAAGIALVSVVVGQLLMQTSYRPLSQEMVFSSVWQIWLTAAGVAAGFLWLAGLIFAVREPGIFLPRKSCAEQTPKSGSPPIVFGWARSRAVMIALGGAVLISFLWLRDHDPKELISLEPKHQGHTLTYGLEHWYNNSWGSSVNGEAEAAVQAMGAKAVPLLVDWIGRPYNSGFDYSGRALKALKVLGPAAQPAVPKLIAIIGRGDAPQRALLAIGPVAAPELAAKYVETLADTNPPAYNWRSPKFTTNPAHVRECIVNVLAQMGTNASAAIPALIQGAGSRQPWTQHSAISALGRIGAAQPDMVIPALTNLLKSADATTTAELALALGNARENRFDEVFPVLVGLMQSTNMNAVGEAAIAAALAESGHAHPQTVVPVLLSIFEHPRTNTSASREQYFISRHNRRDSEFWFESGRVGTRASVADALATFGDAARAAIPALLAAGNDKNPALRTHISCAILKIAPGTGGALDPLVKNLDEPDVQVRREAMWSIQSLGTNAAPAIPALVKKSWSDPERDLRRMALEAIERIHFIDDTLVAAMSESLGSTNAEMSTAAARLLSQFTESNPQVFLALLRGFVVCPDMETRGIIKDHLRHAVERNYNPLPILLNSEDPQIRFAALKLVDECGFDFKETRHALIKAKSDKNPEARALATNMLIEACARVIGHAAAEERICGGNLDATNAQGQTPLHLAIPRVNSWPSYWPENGGPYNEVLQLLQADVNVNVQDKDGFTPLHVLMLNENSFGDQTATALLVAGANPNLHDKHGRTPVHLALTGEWPWRQADSLGMLAGAGANFSVTDETGKTPLHYLANLNGHDPIFFIRGIDQIFISAKVDFNARDNDGNTPLHLASKSGTREVFNWLLENGADLDATNQSGETPRMLELKANNRNSRSRTSPASAELDIFQAIREDKTDAVKRILNANPQLANTPAYGQTPLRLAVTLERTNIVALLDTHNTKWDAPSAVMAGRGDLLKKILQDRPTAITESANGENLLHLAAIRGNTDLVQQLLSANANPQEQDSFGLSPLGRARLNSRTEVVNLLTARGATNIFFDAVYLNDTQSVARFLAAEKSLANATNQARITPVEIAAAADFTPLLQMLLKAGGRANATPAPPRATPPTIPPFNRPMPRFFPGAWTTTPLNLAVYYNRTNAVEVLLQAGADANQADSHGFAPLHFAVLRNHPQILAQLLQHKANPDAASAELFPRSPMRHGPPIFQGVPEIESPAGETPLHLAAMSGQTNLIELLLKSGANVNATNANAQTPLDEAGQTGHTFRISITPPAITKVMEPFGQLEAPMFVSSVSPEIRKAGAAMILAAGGKHSAPFIMASTRQTSQPIPKASDGTAYHERGCGDYNAQRFTNALVNFIKSRELGSGLQDYTCFRIWLTRARLGDKETANRELAEYLEHRPAGKENDWPLQIGRYLAGQLAESNLLAAAESPDPKTAREQQCEAWFYSGTKRLLEADRMGANEHFKKCLATHVQDFYEYSSATAELFFLEIESRQPAR